MAELAFSAQWEKRAQTDPACHLDVSSGEGAESARDDRAEVAFLQLLRSGKICSSTAFLDLSLSQGLGRGSALALSIVRHFLFFIQQYKNKMIHFPTRTVL